MAYSQNQEEQNILAAVGDRVGTFLDVGAYDGNHLSNTKALIERGWGGVLVEPAVEPFQALASNHGSNPKLTLIHAAVGVHRGFSRFWNSRAGLATTEEWSFEKWRLPYPYFDPPCWIYQMSMADLLERFPGPYDVVTIDTEGTSVKLFQAFVEIYHYDPPKVLVVEHDSNQHACLKAVASKGYEVVESNAENLVLVRKQ